MTTTMTMIKRVTMRRMMTTILITTMTVTMAMEPIATRTIMTMMMTGQER